jgi:hypothetical protein
MKIRKIIIVMACIMLSLFSFKVNVLSAPRVIGTILKDSDVSMSVSLRWSDKEVTTPIRITSMHIDGSKTVVVTYVTGVNEEVGFSSSSLIYPNDNFPMKLSLVLQGTQNNEAQVFSDLPLNTEERDSILNLYYQGILNGYEDSTVRPNSFVTRAEFAAMMVRSARYTQVAQAKVSFVDVLTSHWAFKDVSTLSSKGIINGYTDGSFKPSGLVKLSEVLKMVDMTFSTFETKINHQNTLVDHWSNPYFESLIVKNLVRAHDSYYKVYTPELMMTRGQCAVLISRVLEQHHETRK